MKIKKEEGWISVNERSPKDNCDLECADYIYFYSPKFGILTGFYDEDKYRKDYTSVYDCKITHWREINKPQ